MDLDSDDAVLHALAQGNTMDYAKWPSILLRLIPRLEHIIRHDFPTPTLPPGVATALPSNSVVDTIPQTIDASSQDTTVSAGEINRENDKENAPPATVSTGAATTISPNATNETLPPQILILFNSISTTLTTYFSEYPPHTIQRLAELLLYPKQHYRSLTSYLHAVDRVVHVTSGANIYPLPAAIPDPASASVLSNGANDRNALSWSTPSAQANLGSDESLGGALLTPIPWLRNQSKSSDVDAEVRTESTETIDGPNGAGSIETVTVSVNGIPSHTAASQESLRAEGGVTQGELLRQEQEAGVIPVSQLSVHQSEDDEDEEEIPHARGPQEIGMEDMGPQSSSNSERNGFTVGMQGIDVEAAVGRRVEETDEEEEHEHDRQPSPGSGSPDRAETPKHGADEEMEGDRKRIKDDVAAEDQVLEEAQQAAAASSSKDEGNDTQDEDRDAMVLDQDNEANAKEESEAKDAVPAEKEAESQETAAEAAAAEPTAPETKNGDEDVDTSTD